MRRGKRKGEDRGQRMRRRDEGNAIPSEIRLVTFDSASSLSFCMNQSVVFVELITLTFTKSSVPIEVGVKVGLIGYPDSKEYVPLIPPYSPVIL